MQTILMEDLCIFYLFIGIGVTINLLQKAYFVMIHACLLFFFFEQESCNLQYTKRNNKNIEVVFLYINIFDKGYL